MASSGVSSFSRYFLLADLWAVKGLWLSVFAMITVGMSDVRPALAQSTPIFRMNYSASLWPNSNWPSGAHKTSNLGQRYTEQHLPTGGPSSQPAGRFTQISAQGLSYYGGQYSFGWEHDVDASATYGSTRYYRWRMRFTSDTNARGLSWVDGTANDSNVKILVVGAGAGCGSGQHCRFIAHYGVRRSDQRVRFLIGTDADIPDEGESDFLWDKGVWLNVQIGIRTSTASGRSDGEVRLWVNNNVYGAPNLILQNYVMNAVSFKSVGFGVFNNNGLASDGIFKWDHTDFELDDEYHPTWNNAAGQQAPQAPTSLTISRSAGLTVPSIELMGLALALAAAGARWARTGAGD